jgi:hypothetical protein
VGTRGVAAAAAAVVLLTSVPAVGADPRTRILISAKVAPSRGASFDTESTAVAKSAERAAGFAIDLLPIGIQDAPNALDRSLSTCGAEATCIGARLKSAEITLGLFLVANFSTTPRIITARLIDDHGAVLESAVWEFDPAASDIAAAISMDTWDLLDRSGHAVGGRLVVEPSPHDASISIAGASGAPIAGAATNVFVVLPGEYRVRATKSGYTERSADVRAERGHEAHVPLALESLPTIFESPWLWIGAAAAIAGGIAAFVVIRHNDQSLTLCQSANHGGCP